MLEQVVHFRAMAESMARAQFESAVGQVVSQGLTAMFGETLDLVVELGTAVIFLPPASLCATRAA